MHSNQKGLLPEPNPVQIMKSLNNPAMLQVLLQPQLCRQATKPGKHHVYRLHVACWHEVKCSVLHEKNIKISTKILIF